MMKTWNKKCIALAAPSGGGKSTLCKMLINKYPQFRLSISFTTREPRAGETNGVEYNFISKNEFQTLIDAGDLIEWASVHSNFYGTSRSFIENQTKLGKIVLLDIDVQGVENLKKAFGKETLSIFILPPNMQELERRLRTRNTESEAKLKERLENAREEMAHAKNFDFQLVNHTLEESFTELCTFLDKELISS